MKVISLSGKKLMLAFSVFLIFLSLVFAVQGTGAYAVFYNQTVRAIPIYSVGTDEKKIAISFDCAWGTEHTDDILSALKARNVKATFFMVEFWTTKYPEYVKKIDGAGHEIGTHSSTHSYMSKLNTEDIKKELSSSSLAIENITGKKVELFRPPYGDYNDRLIETASEEGYFTIQWDVDSLDWKDLSATDIALRIINNVKNGSIILCHNNGLHTAESLPLVLDALINKGYSFVPIGELIYRSDYSIDSTGKQIKNQI